ncbi:MAG TPA: hypothetical protein VMT20_10460 [Terriglobia bacterium]|nr:hypothetical protein [Terriglobia bacterium]
MDASALESALKALEASLSSLATKLDVLSYVLAFFTAVVVVGLVVEYNVDFREFFTGRPRDRRKHWPVVVGGIMVILGVSGELVCTFWSFKVESDMRITSSKIENVLKAEISLTGRSAVDAAVAAGIANVAAQQANAEAGSAKSVAGNARDSAKQAIQDAGTAKQGAQNVLAQAKSLGQELTDSEKAARPRRLEQQKFAASLKPIKPFPVSVEAIPDFEAIRTAAFISAGLGMAGWKVSGPVKVRIDAALLQDFPFSGVWIDQGCGPGKGISMEAGDLWVACNMAACNLVKQLNLYGIDTGGPRPDELPLNTIRIRVGLKPVLGTGVPQVVKHIEPCS